MHIFYWYTSIRKFNIDCAKIKSEKEQIEATYIELGIFSSMLKKKKLHYSYEGGTFTLANLPITNKLVIFFKRIYVFRRLQMVNDIKRNFRYIEGRV